MFSSCADKDDPSPILPTPEDTPYILKLKFSEKVEFKEILNKNDIQDLTETETAYFGERIQWSSFRRKEARTDEPQSIQQSARTLLCRSGRIYHRKHAERHR